MLEKFKKYEVIKLWEERCCILQKESCRIMRKKSRNITKLKYKTVRKKLSFYKNNVQLWKKSQHLM